MASPKSSRRILPFRIPIFRIFYSITYTILYLLCLVILAITPISLLWSSIQDAAYQYVIMIGATYILTMILAIFIYSSRLYTNRTVLAAVGKAYVPIEKGEVGNTVRNMIVKQLERSARVAWEGTPRDLLGEILEAEQEGLLPPETTSLNHNDYTVGEIIPLDPQNPPWGRIEHLGWSSPSHVDDNVNRHVQFADVVAELPHLIEARAVSLAPADPAFAPLHGEAVVSDVRIVDLLKRPTAMPMREYLTQLFYLGLVQPSELGHDFLSQYEKARFSRQPISQTDFDRLMSTFAKLLSGMMELEPAIVDQIRAKSDEKEYADDGHGPEAPVTHRDDDFLRLTRPSPPSGSPVSSLFYPVTAREGESRTVTPFLLRGNGSQESLGSVIYRTPRGPDGVSTRDFDDTSQRSLRSSHSGSLPSDAGSVLRHSTHGTND